MTFGYLNRKVPELLDPRVPHPRSPQHFDHLNWITMSPHEVFLHPLYYHGAICLALSFLFLNLDFSVSYFFPTPSPNTCSRKLALTLMVASSSTSSNSSSLDRGHSSKSILASQASLTVIFTGGSPPQSLFLRYEIEKRLRAV